MIRANKIFLLFTMLIVLLTLSSCRPIEDGSQDRNTSDSIKIASFNIQIFGQSKASNQEVMDILVQIIRNFDIVAIQEIRDAAGTAILTLRDRVNSEGSSYEVLVGPRVGRTTSKEQYAYMYNTKTIEILPNYYTFDDDGDGNDSNEIDDSNNPNDLFEREPFIAHFRVKSADFDFVLINIHTKPDDATVEIGYLPDVISDVSPHMNEIDVICLDDFNADGSYFYESTYTSIFPSDQYNWLITNLEDTTVAVSDNTYDRIVTTLSTTEDFVGTAEVYRFDQLYDFSSQTLDPSDVSDHYPVWVEFFTNKDTD